MRLRLKGCICASSAIAHSLDPALRETMDTIEARTRGNTRLTLAVAINYGGRDELRRAAARPCA